MPGQRFNQFCEPLFAVLDDRLAVSDEQGEALRRAKRIVQAKKLFYASVFSPSFSLLTVHRSLSFDHLVHPRQHIRRYRQADLLGCCETDYQLAHFGVLHWKIGGPNG